MTPFATPAPQWRRSRHCGASNTCVEVAPVVGAVHVRDSKHPHMPVLTLTPAAFAALLDAIKEDR